MSDSDPASIIALDSNGSCVASLSQLIIGFHDGRELLLTLPEGARSRSLMVSGNVPAEAGVPSGSPQNPEAMLIVVPSGLRRLLIGVTQLGFPGVRGWADRLSAHGERQRTLWEVTTLGRKVVDADLVRIHLATGDELLLAQPSEADPDGLDTVEFWSGTPPVHHDPGLFLKGVGHPLSVLTVYPNSPSTLYLASFRAR